MRVINCERGPRTRTAIRLCGNAEHTGVYLVINRMTHLLDEGGASPLSETQPNSPARDCTARSKFKVRFTCVGGTRTLQTRGQVDHTSDTERERAVSRWDVVPRTRRVGPHGEVPLESAM
jgi:hypothetical protein